MKLIIIQILLLFVSFSVFGSKEENKQDTAVHECKLRYPAEAIKKGIQGTVEIKVIFDANCNMSDYKVVKSLGYGCDEVAIESLICIQERLKKEKKQNCEEGYEDIFPFSFKLD